MASLTAVELFEKLDSAQQSNEIQRIRLSGATVPDADGNLEYTIRPVIIKEEILFQWTGTNERGQQRHQNLEAGKTLERIRTVFGQPFRNLFVSLNAEQWQIRLTKKNKIEFHCHQAKQNSKPVVPLAHNREKNYLIPEGQPVPFLVELGVMTPEGKVRKSQQRKFRQINRFVEFVADLADHFPGDRPVRIVDYGCGKSYLTFAVRELITQHLKRSVFIQAFDSNPQVISACEKIREKLNIEDLKFETATIESATIEGPIDLAIWLHACDTATDDALMRSVSLEATTILAVPCCQHELHHQIESETLAPLLKHGILRERFASLLTDTLRASYLEAAGYRTQVIEFIDTEHTPKNLLLRAVKTDSSIEQRQQLRTDFEQLQSGFGIQQFRLS